MPCWVALGLIEEEKEDNARNIGKALHTAALLANGEAYGRLRALYGYSFPTLAREDALRAMRACGLLEE